MITKTLGYIVAVVGLAGVAAWALPNIKSMIPVPGLSQIGDTTLLVASLIVAAVGLYVATRGSNRMRKGVEVPIYRGKNIVGYRRH